MNDHDILHKIAIPRAKEKARVDGLKVGQTIAHVSDSFVYRLKEIVGNSAIGWLGKEGSEKTFPLGEVFDPNDAHAFALEELVKQQLARINVSGNN